MNLKRFAAGFLSSLIFIGAAASVNTASALAEEEISAPSAILIEADSKKVLYEKNPHEVRPCASITKVMTLLLVMEAIESGRISLDDKVTASAHAASMGGSDIWLEEGEVMSVNDMIKATVVASANDAAVALAELVCGTEDEFVAKMNQKAAELQMNDTVFKNCNGLDEDGHVTSAYDVAVMSSELIKYEKIFDYTSIWLDFLRDGKTQIVNTNKLLKTYKGITGLKTGTTSKAGSCISATAERDSMKLIAVVLGAQTGTQRFKDAAVLLDYGFANFECVKPEVTPEALAPLAVKKGMKKFVELSCNADRVIVTAKGDKEKLKSTLTRPEEIEAPFNANEQVGSLVYTLDGKEVCSFPITVKESVGKITFSSVMALLKDVAFKM